MTIAQSMKFKEYCQEKLIEYLCIVKQVPERYTGLLIIKNVFWYNDFFFRSIHKYSCNEN